MEMQESMREVVSRMEEQMGKVKADVADLRREMRQGHEELSEQLGAMAAR